MIFIYYSFLLIIIHHYSLLFRVVPYYSVVFRVIPCDSLLSVTLCAWQAIHGYFDYQKISGRTHRKNVVDSIESLLKKGPGPPKTYMIS